MALDKGWIYLDYGGGNQFQIRCKKWTWDWEDDPTYADYAGDGHFGFSIRTYKRVVKIYKIFIDNNTDYYTFLANMDTLQSGNAYKLRIKIKSTPLYHKWDGTYYDMPVIFHKLKGMEKIYRGDNEFWDIGQLILRQAGALSGT